MPRNAPNRTDLLTPGVPTKPPPGQGQPNGQPITVPTGLPYGEAGALGQAQAAVPVPQAPGPPSPPGPPAPGAPPQAAGPPVDPMTAARNYQMPNLGALNRPTERPQEPITAGLPAGPGPGPTQQSEGMGALLTRMAAQTNSAALAQLAQRANSLQQ
jgi:hypothetical protein